MIIGRIIGWLLVALAAVIALGGATLAVKGNTLTEVTGAVWYRVDLATLNGSQVIIERHLKLPGLWENFALPLLNWPLWAATLMVVAVPAVLGLMLVAAFRPRNGATAAV